MREIVLNKTSHVRIDSRSNLTMVHTFSGIPRGAKYEISVATNASGAVPANITAAANPLPAPRLMSIYPEKNGSYVVVWKEVKDMTSEK
jgi:hypothetical protein